MAVSGISGTVTFVLHGRADSNGVVAYAPLYRGRSTNISVGLVPNASHFKCSVFWPTFLDSG